MFKVLDRQRKIVGILSSPINPSITHRLGGIGELKFSVPASYNLLELEGYIQVDNEQEYVIKEIVTHGTNREVVCMLNIEEILGRAWATFRSQDNDLNTTVKLILSGTPWTFTNNSASKVKRNLYGTMTNSYNLLQYACTVFGVEFVFNTEKKHITFVDKVGEDVGAYFINEINLRQLNIDSHTHKFITRVIPVGKDGLTIESVNGGKNYLENYSYSDKIITGIWQSDIYDKPEPLKEDAKRFLDEMAEPYITYEAVVHDFYTLTGNYAFKYALGDIVTLIDGTTQTRLKQRIVERTYNLIESDKDTVHIANKNITFEDYYKQLQTILDMTESVIGSGGTISGGVLEDGSVGSDALASGIIKAEHITAGSINADHIQAGTIVSEHIVADSITSDHIKANSIQSHHIVADAINTEHITAGAITAGSGIIADGAIGDALITNLDAGKINAGRLNTSNVIIQSDSGNMLIRDNTLQINDDKDTTRVQIGKDNNGDYNMYVLDAEGKVMFDATGITADGIQSPIIRDDMVSDNAHINGKKINIDSVITEINDSETMIKTSKLEFDDTGQTLNVAFKQLTDSVDDIDKDFTDFKETDFKVAQGEIKTLIKDTHIEQDGKTYTLKEKFASLEQTADGLVSTVAKKTDKDTIISTINQSAEAVSISASKVNLNGYVTISSLGSSGSTTIHGDRIQTDTISLSTLNSNNTNPILKLFPQNGSYCSIDATKQYEAGGKGSWIRLKWDRANYWYVGKDKAGVYLNNATDETEGESESMFWVSTERIRLGTAKIALGTGNCRIDTAKGTLRLYVGREGTTDGDRGIKIYENAGRLELNPGGMAYFKDGEVYDVLTSGHIATSLKHKSPTDAVASLGVILELKDAVDNYKRENDKLLNTIKKERAKRETLEDRVSKLEQLLEGVITNGNV